MYGFGTLPTRLALQALAALAFLAFVWYHGYSTASDACENEKLELIAKEAARNDIIAREYETKLARAKANGAKSRSAINAELDSGAGYDCPINANGVRILREAATNHTR